MSRIGKLPIEIPSGTTVEIKNNVVVVNGAKGTLSYEYSPLIQVKTEGEKVLVSLKEDTVESRKLWGLVRTLIANMIVGASKGYEKQLEIVGIGYRGQMNGNKLVLSVGFSHPVEIIPPEGINLKIERNQITVSGADKQLVGETAARIRSVKKPEPYKGKGIKYSNEKIRRKAGKAAKAR
jgi:large subunit ribosomal protein L6